MQTSSYSVHGAICKLDALHLLLAPLGELSGLHPRGEGAHALPASGHITAQQANCGIEEREGLI